MKSRKNTIKTDLFATNFHRQKLDQLDNPLLRIALYIDFPALATDVDRAAPRPVNPQGGHPLYRKETMIRIFGVETSHNLSDKQMEYQLLDHHSHQPFCGRVSAARLPDRTTIWHFENRIGVAGANALFAAVEQHGHVARGEQIMDTTQVPALRQHFSRDDKEQIKENAMPANWNPARRRQKNLDATWMKKHGKGTYGFNSSISVDRKHKLIRKRVIDTVPVHDCRHFETVPDNWNASAEAYTDRDYPSQRWEEQIKAQGYQSRIQRKDSRNRPQSEPQQRCNHKIAKVRTRVEHIFSTMEQMGGKGILTIGQACADFALTMMTVTYNIKPLVFLEEGPNSGRYRARNAPNHGKTAGKHSIRY